MPAGSRGATCTRQPVSRTDAVADATSIVAAGPDANRRSPPGAVTMTVAAASDWSDNARAHERVAKVPDGQDQVRGRRAGGGCREQARAPARREARAGWSRGIAADGLRRRPRGRGAQQILCAFALVWRRSTRRGARRSARLLQSGGGAIAVVVVAGLLKVPAAREQVFPEPGGAVCQRRVAVAREQVAGHCQSAESPTEVNGRSSGVLVRLGSSPRLSHPTGAPWRSFSTISARPSQGRSRSSPSSMVPAERFASYRAIPYPCPG